MKKAINRFLREHILMPASKRQEIKLKREVVEAFCADDKDFRELFEAAFRREEKEIHATQKKVLISFVLMAIFGVLLLWIIWTVPLLFKGRIWGFIFHTIVRLGSCVLLLGVIRSLLDTLHKAFLGAEAEARGRYKELRKAEEASKKVAQGKGPRFQASPDLTRSYITSARQTRASKTRK